MPLDVQLIRESFDEIGPVLDMVVSRFLEILWDDFPASRPLFADVEVAKAVTALKGGLATVIATLDHVDAVARYLNECGSRHGTREISQDDLVAARSSFVKSLAETYAACWTADLAREWSLTCSTIATLTQEGFRSRSRLSQAV